MKIQSRKSKKIPLKKKSPFLHFIAANDLPPKYEDVVKSPYTGVPIELIRPSSSQQPPPPHLSVGSTLNNGDSAHTQSSQRY